MSGKIDYDEFGMFQENAEEVGLSFDQPPKVERNSVAMPDGRKISALVWGTTDPSLVLLHGGGQNAHTWDTVALALKRSLVAIDLPGHGYSDSPKHAPDVTVVEAFASDIAVAIGELAPRATVVVGMSLGGLTTVGLLHEAPELVRAAVLVDITPGTSSNKASKISKFVRGPESFATFEEIFARTQKYNPTRSPSSLRRGILHNAVQRDDGSWVWRHQRFGDIRPHLEMPDRARLWNIIKSAATPIMLVRGMRPESLVDDLDEQALIKCSPSARVEHVAAAGHNIQGSAPLQLAALIEDFAARQT